MLVLAFVLPASVVPVTGNTQVSSAVAIVAVDSSGAPHVEAQAQEAVDDDDRVPVQVWTIIASLGACAVGLLGFYIRLRIGRVAPPPEQPDAGDH
jgi:hypothetical protein